MVEAAAENGMAHPEAAAEGVQPCGRADGASTVEAAAAHGMVHLGVEGTPSD